MSSSSKKRHNQIPLNTPYTAQKTAFATFHKGGIKIRRRAAKAVLCIFAFIFIAALGGFQHAKATLKVDKTVDAYQVKAKSAVAAFSDNLMDADKPRIAGSPAVKPKLNVVPQEAESHIIAKAEAAETETPEHNSSALDEAAFQSSVAKTLTRKGDIEQALRFQHRAAELDPHNMYYQLGLAVLYDRIGATKSAAALYQKVIDAYERHDATLPSTLDVADIRARADYLISKD